MDKDTRYKMQFQDDGYCRVLDTRTGRPVMVDEGFTVASLLTYRLNGGTLTTDVSEIDEVAETIEARS